MPYYSPTLHSCAWSKQFSYLYDNPLPHLELSDSNVQDTKSSTSFSFATCASDDFNLSLFLGAPLCFFMDQYAVDFDYVDKNKQTQSTSWFDIGTVDDNIYSADPCRYTYPAEPGNGEVPSTWDKVSTVDLSYNLPLVIITNKDLTTTNDAQNLFTSGC